MDTTREQILTLLQRMGGATAEELALALELAPATVRRHLDILQRDNFITFERVRKKSGRPEHRYTLTELGEECLPKEYKRLLSLLVDEMAVSVDGQDEAKLKELLTRLGERMARDHEAQVNSKPKEKRFDAVLLVLNQEGFSCEGHAENGHATIHITNCPFRCAAQEHKEICALDQRLVTRLMNAEVTRTQCIAQGDQACRYELVLPLAQAAPAGGQEVPKA